MPRLTRLPARSSRATRRAMIDWASMGHPLRSEEHTSELQSRCNIVCRLLLEKKTVVHPRLHGGLYPDYPPLYFWTSLPVAKLRKDATPKLSPLAVKLPSVLGAVLNTLRTPAL